jgi:PKD repeat protein
MKKIIYLSLLLTLVLFSCQPVPRAKFFVDNVEPDVGAQVTFTNESEDADRFEWDFGDGYGSEEANPVHYFTATGSYDVILTAYSKKGVSDKATITIDVLVPTLLVIEVVEYYDEYVVANASVRLYPTKPDWIAEQKMVDEGVTDANGVVVFSHLGNDDYFVDVWEKNHDNYTLAAESESFIRIQNVYPHRINWFVAWVDKATHTKGEGRKDNSMVVKKLERKFKDRTQPVFTEEEWKALYEKSIKVK